MKLVRPAAVLAVGAALVLSNQAGAGTVKSLVLTDAAGDANAVNDQGLLVADPFPGTPGPGSQASKDILSVTYNTTTKRVAGKTTCTGFTVALKLSAAPDASGTLYRIDGKGTTNTSLWWLQYDGASTKVRWSDGSSTSPLSSGTAPLVNAAKVSGSTITFTVTEADLKASNEKLKGFVITGPGADIRSVTPAATLPQWDVLPTDDSKTFKPC